jgi:hypothetical protein
MSARLHPGVYVKEVPSGTRAIEAAGTSTTIFERGFGGYRRHQSGSAQRVVLRYAIDAFFATGDRLGESCSKCVRERGGSGRGRQAASEREDFHGEARAPAAPRGTAEPCHKRANLPA